MRKALVVGINHYERRTKLYGCVADASAVANVLARHGDRSPNFEVKTLLAPGQKAAVSWRLLKESVRELFAGDGEVALLYFAGHGYIEPTGGYLCGSDSISGDDGLSLSEVLALATASRALNKVIILDSCHSGIIGSDPISPRTALVAEGITILTAAEAEQYATEENRGGIFTALLVDALEGAAANLVGEVTPGSVYAHVDQSLGSWGQRPVFKTNVKRFVSLRRVKPPIPIEDLRQIAELFPEEKFEFKLDRSFEPESEAPDPVKTRVFATLQKYNRVNLLVPVGAPHMWHAAMEGKSCKLTVLGEHYRRLVAQNRI